MSRRQKIVTIAVLAILALLHTGAAANARGTGTGEAGQHPGGLVGWLGGLVGRPPAAPRSQLSSACLADSVLTIKGGCTLTVARSDHTRRVRLHAVDPLTVTSRPPGSDDPASADVKAGDDVDVTVDADGGPIGLACAVAGATCTVTLP